MATKTAAGKVAVSDLEPTAGTQRRSGRAHKPVQMEGFEMSADLEAGCVGEEGTSAAPVTQRAAKNRRVGVDTEGVI